MTVSFASTSFTPREILASTQIPLLTEPSTIASGQTLQRGAVVGKITASGKLVLSLSAASDGSQTPYGVLADDVDASGADTAAEVYLSGHFNHKRLTFGTGHTAASTRAGLRNLGIFI